MNSDDSVLSPHHLGEAFVRRLLENARLAELPAHDPKQPHKRCSLGDLVHLPEPRPGCVQDNASLERRRDQPAFDGMHEIDCAVVFSQEVLAIELKLGTTRLAPRDFAKRFVDAPKLTHDDTRFGGSMITLLDWNRQRAPKGQPSVSLYSSDRPVRKEWLLMLRQATWNDWQREGDELLKHLGTNQLAAVLTLEEVVWHTGVDSARQIALELAKASIDTWFTNAIEL